MTVAEQIYHQAQQLPEDLAREVLDFIGYLRLKHALAERVAEHRGARFSSTPIRENPDDPVWNDLLFRRPLGRS